MKRRNLITALVATAAVGTQATPAHAELRRLKVTLVTGQELTVNVDVPAGTPADQIALSGMPAAVRSVVDLGPVTPPAVSAAPTPAYTPTPVPAETATATPAAPTPEPTPAAPAPTPEPMPAAPAPTPAAPAPTPTPGITATPTPTATPPQPESAPLERPRKARRRGNLRGNAQVMSGELSAPDPEPQAPASATPAPGGPSVSVPGAGAPAVGVPNFFIERFRIPPFLLPIYQAAGIEYGVRWEVLAAINEIETDYGRNLNVSSAGALGWMQFIPSSWEAYGVDANQDGVKDPYNPLDAIFAAARYLRAAGAAQNLRRAIFAYNHANWYVDSVLERARLIGGLPTDLVGSLTGLTHGRFPVSGRATYAGRTTRRALAARRGATPARPIAGDGRRGAVIVARRGAAVVAVTDGRIAAMGRTRRLGRFVTLQDSYGNAYTYARLGDVAARYPAPPRREVTQAELRRELALPRDDAAPMRAASRTTREQSAARRRAKRDATARKAASRARSPRSEAPPEAVPVKERLFAHPDRPRAAAAGGAVQVSAALGAPGRRTRALRRGARVTAGTVLGRVGTAAAGRRASMRFEIRPAGRRAPRIDPSPILDGWKLLESTDVYRAGARNALARTDSAAPPSVGQILLMGKDVLARRVLANPKIELYACGRLDVRAGLIDRRVLATLEFLAASGLRPTVSSLDCGHSYYTASGNVSHHSSGNAVDIAAINGVPIAGHQGPGSITELTIQRLLALQGSMKPDQIISLMTFDGTDNTFAMGDHADHIHIGWQPQYGANPEASEQVDAILEPSQWIRLMARLGEIDNPEVREEPSRYAVKATKRGSRAHKGE